MNAAKRVGEKDMIATSSGLTVSLPTCLVHERIPRLEKGHRAKQDDKARCTAFSSNSRSFYSRHQHTRTSIFMRLQIVERYRTVKR